MRMTITTLMVKSSKYCSINDTTIYPKNMRNVAIIKNRRPRESTDAATNFLKLI